MLTPVRFDSDVREFLEQKMGNVIMLCDDPIFVRTLRTVMLKTLAIKRDCLVVHQDSGGALRAVRDTLSAKMPVMVFADRIMHGLPTTDFMRGLKSVFPEAKLLVMTQETSKDTLSLLYEIGVDSIITKPVSIGTLIEKMAGAIKPQGKISQLVHEGKTRLEMGETAKVKEISENILALKPGSPVGLMLMGDAMLAEGDRSGAIAAYEQAHQGSVLYLEPLKKLANAHRGNDEDAYLVYMKKLDKISPLNTERKCEIGKVYVRKSDMENADKYFAAALENAQREALGYVDRIASDIAESLADVSPAMAEKYYVKLLEMKGDNLTKDDMVTFNRLGIALRRQGRWQDAIENYKKALTVVPDDERVLYNMGLAHADGQQYQAAVRCYDQVLRHSPDFRKTAAVVAFNMANAYAMTKDVATAKVFLESALEIDPNHASSQKLLARLEALTAR